MTIAASAAPSLDFETLGASFALLVGAVTSVVFGLWKGWQLVKKSVAESGGIIQGGDERMRVISAAITETTTLARLTESNRELQGAVCDLVRTVEDQSNEIKQNRYTMQQASEAMQRLTSAVEHNSRVIERTGLKL